jgi:hypothetical protein
MNLRILLLLLKFILKVTQCDCVKNAKFYKFNRCTILTLGQKFQGFSNKDQCASILWKPIDA